ncbi:uncharacterized protein BT62DRAFT_558085 [Guyanagaster necrorhizus]|uniref:Uncharacterized protein n=1 Tax=Guyanagaster necrorhizus TaxID=856835 RepID=A0A9P8AMP8_9AGAR|nr:uncharacterized protein BT62DRAFT_558085 [Guyanagaster necrorhizus MCA 3950]KAG7440931.1 hypothetical protein BT62DRAFT_558085 [Guyanagaster necrorhizus MCA 3950]
MTTVTLALAHTSKAYVHVRFPVIPIHSPHPSYFSLAYPSFDFAVPRIVFHSLAIRRIECCHSCAPFSRHAYHPSRLFILDSKLDQGWKRWRRAASFSSNGNAGGQCDKNYDHCRDWPPLLLGYCVTTLPITNDVYAGILSDLRNCLCLLFSDQVLCFSHRHPSLSCLNTSRTLPFQCILTLSFFTGPHPVLTYEYFLTHRINYELRDYHASKLLPVCASVRYHPSE